MKHYLAAALVIAAFTASGPARAQPLAEAQVKVVIQKGVAYGSVDGVDLLADVAFPAGEGPFPVILSVHGGRWVGSSRTDAGEGAIDVAQWAGFGFFAMTIDYRLAGAAPPPACYQDLQCAIRWVHAHAEDYRIDRERVFLIGMSAGGHLVSLAATLGDGPFPKTGGWEAQSAEIRGIVSLSAPYELEKLSWGNLWKPAEGDALEARRLASPIRHVTSKTRPMLILHSDDDGSVPVQQAIDMAEAMEKAKAPHRLRLFKNQGHMRVTKEVIQEVRTFIAETPPPVRGDDVKRTEVYARIKKALDATPAIDTHEHLRSFDELPTRVDTPEGRGMTLYSVWAGSYFGWTNPLAPWPGDGRFETWWAKAQHSFDDARATSFYRSMLPAFRDLYGVDFDTITKEQAAELNRKIFENYRDDRWLIDVVTRRANIELMLIDPYWSRMQFAREYQFGVPVLNVTTLMSGSHPARFESDNDSPYAFAKRKGLPAATLDDYLAVVETIFQTAVEADAVCLKSTQAYQRPIRYEPVTKERAAEVFGKPPQEITPVEQRDFEDFMFWRVCALSAKYELPFQIHTGQARVQGSNPMLLVDAIEANPETKFILFHGGYPWVGETGVIAMRHKNVWIDSCWLPTLSYTMAKRAYQEWLEAVPSNRIMWGADTVHAEGIYAMTEFTRQCLAEALAEKVERGELREEHALRIGRQILRDNALEVFPKMRRLLWRKECRS